MCKPNCSITSGYPCKKCQNSLKERTFSTCGITAAPVIFEDERIKEHETEPIRFSFWTMTSTQIHWLTNEFHFISFHYL
jgi:hypothetical protein